VSPILEDLPLAILAPLAVFSRPPFFGSRPVWTAEPSRTRMTDGHGHGHGHGHGMRSPHGTVSFLLLSISLGSIGCERGCGWGWLREHGVAGAPRARGSSALPTDGLDCPDGLARCADGEVEASRLARIAQPCRGPESACTCPWEPVATCAHGCVADGLEVIIERSLAATQLCAPETGPPSRPSWKGPVVVGPTTEPPAGCDVGQLYRCAGGVVVDCAAHLVAASCSRGCFAEGAAIDEGDRDEPVRREAAFAILCSR